MQGMIADTGGSSHLFKHHHTAALITDWVLHPFAHLRRPPAAHMAAMHHVDPIMARRHHCPLEINRPDLDCATCPYRRVIWVEVDRGQTAPLTGEAALALELGGTPWASSTSTPWTAPWPRLSPSSPVQPGGTCPPRKSN